MYIAPLRTAVLYLADLNVRWDDRSVASLAHVERTRARAYCTSLERVDVLVQRDEVYAKGWAFDAWAEEKPRTKPGGHSREYLEERELRLAAYEEERQRRLQIAARVREARVRKGWGVVRAAREAHIGVGVLQRMESGKWDSRPETISKIAAVLGLPCVN